MAKPKKLPAPNAAEITARDLAQIEVPKIKWKVVAQIGLAVAVAWTLAIGSVPYVGYWLVGIVGVLTLVLVGFAAYVIRLTRRQARLVAVLRQATDEQRRKEALARLEAEGSKDAMAALARAQLVLRDDPREAMRILEAIPLANEPGVVQDEVRANLALLYLMQGRPRDARPLVDALRLDRQASPKSKALYAAVMAETYARTGKAEEAKKLFEIYKPEDPEYGEVALLLYRAQVYTYLATKNRGLMRKAMAKIAEKDPNALAPFMVKSASPELQQAVREVLSEAGYQTRTKTKIQRV